MARTNFENLRVYKLSEKLADHIWDIALEWSVFARDTVGKQLVKAADSIGANISDELGPTLNAYLRSIGVGHSSTARK
jgi:four helix bundle protein